MPSLHPIFDYFDYDNETDVSKCKIIGCKLGTLKGKHANNLSKHIEKKHRELQDELKEKRSRFLSERNRSRVIKKVKSPTVMVKIDRKELLMGCIELTTINGRPFTIFKDSGLQRIVRPIIREFTRNDIPVGLYPDHIKRKARELQKIVKKQISSEINGKLLSLQLDLTRHLRRCILGINVQYYVGDKLVVRTLAMRRLLIEKTAINLANEVQDVLKEFGAGIDYIYTISTDNGSNVLGCTTALQIIQERATEEYMTSCSNNDLDLSYLNRLLEIETNRIAQGQPLHFLHSVPCCAHILQLAMGDFFGKSPMDEILTACRKLVHALIAPNVYNLLVKKGLKKPILDADVRWSTVYGMVCFFFASKII